MPLMRFQYHSDALNKNTTVTVILPVIHRYAEVKPYKTLYLLHGYTEDHTNWTRYANMQRYASKYGIAVVMPDGGKGWYTDTASGDNYMTFVAEELPKVCRTYFNGMSHKREDNYIAGNSMGGYGAMKIALTYPDKFCGCACLSGALDVTRENHPVDLTLWRSIFGLDLKDAKELAGTKHDIYALVDKNFKAGTLPRLFVWCGKSDPWIDCTFRLREQLVKLGVDHCYSITEGGHEWQSWDLHIQHALAYLLTD